MEPRILLVEDDPTSRAFLVAAAAALPSTVDAVATLADAVAAVAAARYDLLLVDAHLPDGNGAGLLRTLRAGGDTTPALAHTAARELATRDALLAAGFVAVLVKPLATAALHAALRAALGRGAYRIADAADATAAAISNDDDVPTWDDAAALRALNGQLAHVLALRGLFRDELPGARDAVALAQADGNGATLAATLHRLQASCGFVGAARLGRAVDALRRDPSPARLRAFLDAAQLTLSSP